MNITFSPTGSLNVFEKEDNSVFWTCPTLNSTEMKKFLKTPSLYTKIHHLSNVLKKTKLLLTLLCKYILNCFLDPTSSFEINQGLEIATTILSDLMLRGKRGSLLTIQVLSPSKSSSMGLSFEMLLSRLVSRTCCL